MNENQRMFCLEYLKDFNAARAYRAVYERGVPLKNPAAGAYRLLRKEYVMSFLSEEIACARGMKVAEAEEVMAYFTSVMRGEIEMSDRERNKAAEILAKRFGLLDAIGEVDMGGGGEKVVIMDDV